MSEKLETLIKSFKAGTITSAAPGVNIRSQLMEKIKKLRQGRSAIPKQNPNAEVRAPASPDIPGMKAPVLPRGGNKVFGSEV